MRRSSIALSLSLAGGLATALLSVSAPAYARAPQCQGVRATIVGTDHRDTIRGTNGRDVIVGGAGRDTIMARGGNDLVCAGRGDDVVEGGSGNDELYGGADGQTLPREYCLLGDHLDGGQGADLLDPGRDRRRTAPHDCGTRDLVRFRHGGAVRVDLSTGLATGQGHDRIVVDGQGLEVIGSDEDDVLVGSDLDEELDARLGNDSVRAGGGDDRIVEGHGRTGDDVYDLGAGADFFFSRSGRDEVLGAEGDDYLALQSPSAVRADGGEGDDRLLRYAVPGGDRLAGGEGFDELTVDLREEAADASVLDIPLARWTVGERGIDVLGFEEWVFAAPVPITVWGSAARDIVTASGYGIEEASLTAHLRGGDDAAYAYLSDDYVDGGDGLDTADLGPGADTCVNVEGGAC